MRRVLALVVVSLLLAPAAAQAARPRAALVACDRDDGAAVFEGRMDALRGAERMQMRFRLQSARPGGTWHRLAAPGFSAWATSDPGRTGYVFTRRVEGLSGPASYRVQLRFRWLGADGSVLARARATSRACRQPDPRPNLVVTHIAVRPAADPVSGAYLVRLRNTGRGAAGPSALSLAVAGGALLSAPVPPLAAGERAVVALAGPACVPAAPITATADAHDAIDERREDDDALTVLCPAAPGAHKAALHWKAP